MNYRAWNHHCWLVSYMTREQRLMLRILKDSTCKLENASPGYSVEFLKYGSFRTEELDWNEMLIKHYIGREALWLHRRFLSLCWMKQFATNLHDVSCHSDLKISTSDSFKLIMSCISSTLAQLFQIMTLRISKRKPHILPLTYYG
ncbi:hypothetical protein CFP56_022814 [Quercus suber]|uniref:Uncharacterized protein n=1 Tax=Quercus suber TaxID=58331 RepID=A0AAW0KAW0_QUESU